MIEYKSIKVLKDNEFKLLEKLDKIIFTTYNLKFADTYWKVVNFQYELDKKYDLSYVVKFKGNIVGYCIASMKFNNIYIHRFVAKSISKQKLADNFILFLLTHVYQKKKIFLMVNIKNNIALKFYQNYGFNIVQDKNCIVQYINSNLQVVNNIINVSKGYKCYLMQKN